MPPRALPGWVEMLDATECARAARLRWARHRVRFLAAHAGLRAILGRVIGCRPRDLRFAASALGKPHLVAPAEATALAFNLSHSRDHALVAWRQSGPVGVDLEVLPRTATPPWELLDALTPAERAGIEAAPPGERAWHTWRCWVRKEAVLKALGCGLSGGLDRFTVSTGDTARLEASALPGLDPARWSLAALDRPGHWAAALAWPGPWQPPVWREWHWEAPF